MSKQNFWQDAPLNGANVAHIGKTGNSGIGKTHAIIHLYLRVLLQVPAADDPTTAATAHGTGPSHGCKP